MDPSLHYLCSCSSNLEIIEVYPFKISGSQFKKKNKMYMPNIHPYHATPVAARRPPQSHLQPRRMANPYLIARGASHFQDMPNPYALPTDPPPRTQLITIPALVTAPRPSQVSWHLQPRYQDANESVPQEVSQGLFPQFTPRNLEQEHRFRLGFPISEEPELPDLDFGQWQRDADVSLLTLGHDSYDFGSLSGNSFKPTEEESRVLETSSNHEKKVQKAHEQFIRMLRTHKDTEAFAMYDATYDFQFYRIFQGEKSTAKRNAMNNIFGLWTNLFYHRLDGKPYQPSGFMVTLHSLFGELARHGVRYSLAKDFNYRGGFMRELEQRWNKHKLSDGTFAARPTKVKMPEDYAKNIRAAVADGLLLPESDVDDCQLLFACACGTMLGFRGNQVTGGLLNCFLCFVVQQILESSSLCLLAPLLSPEQEHYGLRFSDFVVGSYPESHPSMPGMAYLELKGSLIDKGNKIKGSAPTLYDTRNARRLVHNPNDVLSPYRLYALLCGFAHPDQEYIYCYKGNRELLDQYSSLPDCRGFQMNPTRRIGKNSIGKARVQIFLSMYFLYYASTHHLCSLHSSARN